MDLLCTKHNFSPLCFIHARTLVCLGDITEFLSFSSKSGEGIYPLRQSSKTIGALQRGEVVSAEPQWSMLA